jgi:hypothetical protein
MDEERWAMGKGGKAGEAGDRVGVRVSEGRVEAQATSGAALYSSAALNHRESAPDIFREILSCGARSRASLLRLPNFWDL